MVSSLLYPSLTDDRLMISVSVLTLAWCMLECASNKAHCGTKTLSPPWRPYKLNRRRSPCTRKSWRVSVLVSRVVSTGLIPPVLYVPTKLSLECAKIYRHIIHHSCFFFCFVFGHEIMHTLRVLCLRFWHVYKPMFGSSVATFQLSCSEISLLILKKQTNKQKN